MVGRRVSMAHHSCLTLWKTSDCACPRSGFSAPCRPGQMLCQFPLRALTVRVVRVIPVGMGLKSVKIYSSRSSSNCFSYRETQSLLVLELFRFHWQTLLAS